MDIFSTSPTVSCKLGRPTPCSYGQQLPSAFKHARYPDTIY